jgi:predicted RNA binding protein YcfA (HicA-like mRNA interferase family)
MNYRDLTRKLSSLGCRELPRHGGGSHRKWFNPATDRATVIPDWGSRDLKKGTVRVIIKQLGIDWDAFQSI